MAAAPVRTTRTIRARLSGALVDAVRARRPHRFRHDLAGDPLLDLDALPHLVATAPPREVFHHVGALPLLLARGDAPSLDLPPEEVARGIPANGCWMRVGDLESEPGWCDLVRRGLPGLACAGDLQGQLFVAAPGSVTPAHFDTYHNCLLQVHGSKEVSIGAFRDRAAARREIARRFTERENLRTLPEQVARFVLEPGDALYIPPYAFHWTIASGEVSSSLSCVFSDDWSRRAQLVEQCNRRLRGLGLDPAPPGTSELRDRVKAGTVRAWRAARAPFTR